ncbi:cytochrome c family protein [Pendulispora brunnea]|uniref:Cytochrome c family protein n=1 Tax=Pendulispora brunnea TaxID=2905690 RepID=A0ABZ2KEE5_9BACT
MQIFPRSLNKLPLIAAVATVGLLGSVVFVFWYYFSPKNLQVGYAPIQPVPYSHKLHVGQLGMDCRYCHANIERAAHAMIPATQTCMGCHSVVKTESARLANVRSSWDTGKAIEWVKVHKLPEHTFFDHSAHLAAGVGCATCHGRIDEMEIVRLDKPISMGWCLECHRDPTPNLRPKDQITNMDWRPEMAPAGWQPPSVNPPKHCSGCHR